MRNLESKKLKLTDIIMNFDEIQLRSGRIYKYSPLDFNFNIDDYIENYIIQNFRHFTTRLKIFDYDQNQFDIINNQMFNNEEEFVKYLKSKVNVSQYVEQPARNSVFFKSKEIIGTNQSKFFIGNLLEDDNLRKLFLTIRNFTGESYSKLRFLIQYCIDKQDKKNLDQLLKLILDNLSMGEKSYYKSVFLEHSEYDKATKLIGNYYQEIYNEILQYWKTFELPINKIEDFTRERSTYKQISDFVANESYIDTDGEFDTNEPNKISFITRENGNIVEEEFSDIDYEECRRVAKLIKQTFLNIVESTEVYTVDEWCGININLKS